MAIRGRRHRRFVVEDCTVEYRKHSALSFLGGAPKVAPLVDVSVGGLQFVSEDLYDIGQRLDLKVIIPSIFRSLTVQAEVVWSKRVTHRSSYRVGARLIHPPAEVISLLRTLEERFWALPDERKREAEAAVSRHYPLHLEPRPEGTPARVYDDAAAAAEAAAEAAGAASAPATPPAAAAAPAAAPPAVAAVSAPPAPEPAPAPEAAAPPEPAAEKPPEEPAPEPPQPPEAEPTPPPEEPVPVTLYDLVAGIETRPDAGVLLQGVAKCQILLPGLADRDCFALEVHDNTMRHSGTPSFDRGDAVVFSPNAPARSGDLAFVVTRDGGVFRQVFFDANNVVRLRPLNSWYPEQCFHRAEVQGLWKLVAKFERYPEK
ncbi:MAG TPA: PilZ domain-containing protein [Planctomycetota bacterium]|nr:PilZ domain-containing protein [Planctomycetota bacterium]HRR82734.1 PilZ domain-containing protein [Planctomycetota bacterium]HRT97435.1 PilZ domain-containing protein [Planctomycetota bacterium]